MSRRAPPWRREPPSSPSWRPKPKWEALRIAKGDTKRMQNELKTNTTGTVTIVHVQEGATVETGAALLTIAAPETRAWVLTHRIEDQPQGGATHRGDTQGAAPFMAYPKLTMAVRPSVRLI